MQKTGYLYALFAFLTIVVVLLVFGLYRLVSPGTVGTLSDDGVPVPSDLQAVLHEVNDTQSWIYRMHLHQKQNLFTYPRTVYHINLN